MRTGYHKFSDIENGKRVTYIRDEATNRVVCLGYHEVNLARAISAAKPLLAQQERADREQRWS